MTATSSASATGCRLISNSISSVAAKKQPESVFACMCVCQRGKENHEDKTEERKKLLQQKVGGQTPGWTDGKPQASLSGSGLPGS